MSHSYELQKVEVRFLPELLKDYLGETKIANVDYKVLPQAGFGSVMIKMTIALSNGETLNAVAKVLPPSEETRKQFQIEKTYNNELHFYKTLVPTLNEFRKEQGCDRPLRGIAKFLGGRTTLDGKSDREIDDDAVLVLEDLGALGYRNLPKGVFFDLEASKYLLKDLAELQGTAIAFKLKKPKVFEEIFVSKYQQYIFGEDGGPQEFVPMITKILKENEQCRPHVENKATIWDGLNIPEPREPYGTVTHNDMWVNNTMQRFSDGKVVENKLVDFQLLSYRSAATDVFFFVWTSVEIDVIKSHLDDLLLYYHSSLIETIRNLGCNTDNFSYERFLDEIKHVSTYEFGHAASFALGMREIFPNHSENLGKGKIPTKEEIEKKLSKEIKEFYWFMFLECLKRGWVQE